MAENLIPISQILGEGEVTQARANQALNIVRMTCLGCTNSDQCPSHHSIINQNLSAIRTIGPLADQPNRCALLRSFSAGNAEIIDDIMNNELPSLPPQEQDRRVGNLFNAIFGDREEDEEDEESKRKSKQKRGPKRSGEAG